MKNLDLTQTQVLAIIQKVAQNHRRKTFDIHDESDIEQQVYQIALLALPKYHVKKTKHKDPEKAFENWLNAIVANRLANFYRDRFGVKHKSRKKDTEFEKQKRVNLNHPIELTNLDIPDPFNSYNDKELFVFLLKEMNMQFIELMLASMSGENVGSYYKYRLQNKILDTKKKWELKENT